MAFFKQNKKNELNKFETQMTQLKVKLKDFNEFQSNLDDVSCMLDQY